MFSNKYAFLVLNSNDFGKSHSAIILKQHIINDIHLIYKLFISVIAHCYYYITKLLKPTID